MQIDTQLLCPKRSNNNISKGHLYQITSSPKKTPSPKEIYFVSKMVPCHLFTTKYKVQKYPLGHRIWSLTCAVKWVLWILSTMLLDMATKYQGSHNREINWWIGWNFITLCKICLPLFNTASHSQYAQRIEKKKKLHSIEHHSGVVECTRQRRQGQFGWCIK